MQLLVHPLHADAPPSHPFVLATNSQHIHIHECCVCAHAVGRVRACVVCCVVCGCECTCGCCVCVCVSAHCKAREVRMCVRVE